MRFDDVILQLGEFGAYQKRVYLLTCFVAIPAAMQTLSVVFTLYTPKHRCALPGLPNDTYSVQGPWHQALINASVPRSKQDGFSQCKLYKKDNDTSGRFTNQTYDCSKWVYSKDYVDSSIASDMNMVCDDKSRSTYANMIFMTGALIGGLVMGMLSDKIGRKKVMMFGILGSTGAYLGMAFTNTYLPFVILRFLTAAIGCGMFLPAFVISVELVGPRKRLVAGLLIQAFWSFGLFIMIAMAYFLRDWQYLQIATTIPGAILLLLVFVVPESARWLISQGRYEEASRIIQKAARVNGVILPGNVANLETIEDGVSQENIWNMFKIPTLLIRCLVIFFIWTVSSLMYFGLSLNIDSLSGNVYINFSLSSLMELLGLLINLFLLNRWGRKPVQCVCLMLAGVACLATAFPVIFGGDDTNWITIALSLVGKLGGSASFSCIYIFSSELFPTAMRNSGMGLSYVMSRMGGIAAPFIADISKLFPSGLGNALPLMMFGAAALLAGVLALLLPETNGRVLPETVEDAKRFGKKQKINGGSTYLDLDENTDGIANIGFDNQLEL